MNKAEPHATDWRSRLFGREDVPIVYQAEAADCGLACITMVSNFYGGSTTLDSLRQGTSARGMNIGHLVHQCTRLGLSARPLRAGIQDLERVRLPCILHWEFNHFVVLTRIRRGNLTINDPAVGIRTVAQSEAVKSYTGVALEVAPTSVFIPGNAEPEPTIRQTIGEVRGFKRALTSVLSLGAALELTVVALPFFSQWTLDQVVPTRNGNLLIILASAFLGVSVLNAIVNGLRGWAVATVGIELNYQWTTNTFLHLLRLPMSFFERRTLGGIASRFESISVLQKALTAGLAETIVDGVFAIGTLIVMFLYSVGFASISVGAILIYIAVRAYGQGKMRAASQELAINSAKQRTAFYETLRGIQTLRLFNKEAERSVSWANLLVDQFNADLRLQQVTVTTKAANSLIFNLERIAVVAAAAYALMNAELTVGMLVAYLTYREQFVVRCGGLVDRLAEWKLLRVHTSRLADIVLAKAEQDGVGPLLQDIQSLPATLEMRDISFRYGAAEVPVLTSVSLKVEEGECVAVVGPSGCGKTTLAKILLGLLEPEAGVVLIGGVEASRLRLSDRRGLFGTVMQDDSFFAGSIYDNISFFEDHPDLDRIHECARVCGIDAEIQRMPMGYYTPIGDMGSALSGGQKQRILLARALYRRPRFLLLDEATSQLDIENELRIGKAIGQLQMTRIVIAHRPETIALCDRVIDLQHQHRPTSASVIHGNDRTEARPVLGGS